jgi:hypothetical protein
MHRVRQPPTFPDIPTSNAPPIAEWAHKYWYVIRATALQAVDTLTDAEAGLLVAAMESLKITLPCPECRAHFTADWDTYPFTLEHARDAVLAMEWVKALDDRIRARKAAEAAAEAAAAGTTAETAAVPAAPAASAAPPRQPAAPRTGMRGAAGVRAHAGAGAGMPVRTPAQTALALRASLLETRANIASGGTRGCVDCGKKKVKALDDGVLLGRSAIGSGSNAASGYRGLTVRR